MDFSNSTMHSRCALTLDFCGAKSYEDDRCCFYNNDKDLFQEFIGKALWLRQSNHQDSRCDPENDRISFVVSSVMCLLKCLQTSYHGPTRWQRSALVLVCMIIESNRRFVNSVEPLQLAIDFPASTCLSVLRTSSVLQG